MDSTEKYLKDLKSSNVNQRFDACYYLQLMKEIPESAILALQEATNDPDQLVAKEANKALQAHSMPIKAHDNDSKVEGDNLVSKDSNSSSLNFLKTYASLILVGLFFALLIFGFDDITFLLAFLGGPILFLILVVGVIGYFVSSSRGNSNVKTQADLDKDGEKTSR